MSPSKNSDDIIIEEDSLKETVKTEILVNSSSEDCPVAIEGEKNGEKNQDRKEAANVVKAETISSTENGADESEDSKEIIAVKADEETKEEPPIVETNILTKIANVPSVTMINIGKTKASPVAEAQEMKRKRKTTR